MPGRAAGLGIFLGELFFSPVLPSADIFGHLFSDGDARICEKT